MNDQQALFVVSPSEFYFSLVRDFPKTKMVLGRLFNFVGNGTYVASAEELTASTNT